MLNKQFELLTLRNIRVEMCMAVQKYTEMHKVVDNSLNI